MGKNTALKSLQKQTYDSIKQDFLLVWYNPTKRELIYKQSNRLNDLVVNTTNYYGWVLLAKYLYYNNGFYTEETRKELYFQERAKRTKTITQINKAIDILEKLKNFI